MAVVISAIAGIATTAAVTGAVVAGITIGVTSAAIIGAVVSTIVGGILIDKPSSSSLNSLGQTILTNQRTNNAPIPVIYGTRLTGGAIVFMDAIRTAFFVNLVVSEGEIESFVAFYFNNELIANKHGPPLIDEFYGSETQAANSVLVNALQHYTNAHRLAGTAYLTFSFTYAPFPAGLPLINALVKGVKIFDPRTMTTQWSDNPVLCIRDYLTNARYGRDIDTSLIDDTSFILAANYCDELVRYNGINSVKRYTCDGVAETQNSSLSIINKMLTSCRGLLIFSGGLYKVIIDKPEMAVFTFSEDNIIGGWKILLGNKNSQYNRIRANFFNADKEYQPDIAIVDSQELREQDGGLLERMIDLPFTTDLARAKAIATINLNQSRHPITCEFTSTIEGLRVEVGDVVYISHKTPGWDTHNSGLGKKFRIVRVTIQNNDEVRILASEYADEVYDLEVIDPPFVPTKIGINDLSVCLPPTNLFIRKTQIEISRVNIQMSWNASPDDFVVNYQIGYKLQSQTNWVEYVITDNLFWSARFSSSTTYIDFRVRAINTIGVKSIWLE